MSNLKVISPEILNRKRINESFIFHAFRKIFYKVYYLFLINKYKDNAYDKNLELKWNTINYNRIALVNLIINKFKDPNYLEIGCASNSLFDSIPLLKKTGVDPCKGGNIKKTSDEFFLSNTDKFDVVFIDGLHTYEQIRKDIINSIKNINNNGWIAMHDMLPLNWKEQHIPILTTKGWVGDVWKVAFELVQTEGIEFKIIKIDCGVGVIKVEDKNVLLKNLSNELKNKQFNYFYENLNKLPIIEWEKGLDWINKK